MNLGHRKLGWIHTKRGVRRIPNAVYNRTIDAIRDENQCWRLYVDGQECGKAKAWRHIARWVRCKTYLLCIDTTETR